MYWYSYIITCISIIFKNLQLHVLSARFCFFHLIKRSKLKFINFNKKPKKKTSTNGKLFNKVIIKKQTKCSKARPYDRL